MKAKTIVLTLAIVFVAASIYVVANPQLAAVKLHMGTWKLNESKSKVPAGAVKNNTVVYEASGDNIKVTVDGVDASGSAIHSEWTGKFDGKDYPVTGDPQADMRAYRRVNARTLTFTNKKGGKATVTGRVVVSRDGKSRTVTTTATDAQGKKITSTAVYDKQ